jgi:ribosomal protein S18 acetylase RimI-like enzyme
MSALPEQRPPEQRIAGMSGPPGRLQDGVIVRDAQPSEFPVIGDLRVNAYSAGDFLSDGSHYTETLRGLGRGSANPVLAAVDDGQILGTVMLQVWPDASHMVRGPEEAEIRALAVAPGAQGRGVGRTLLLAAIDRAAAQGVRRLMLCTQPEMFAAQHLYDAAGFRRIPERDWYPVPGFLLLAYARELAAGR